MTHSEQEEGDEEEDENAGYLDNLYGDLIIRIAGEDSIASGGNSKASSISISEVRVKPRGCR